MLEPQIAKVTGFVGFGMAPAFFDRRGRLASEISDATGFRVRDVSEEELRLTSPDSAHSLSLDSDSFYSGGTIDDIDNLPSVLSSTEAAFEIGFNVLELEHAPYVGASATLITEIPSIEDAESQIIQDLGAKNDAVQKALQGEPRPTEWHFQSENGEVESRLRLRLYHAAEASVESELPWDDVDSYPEFLAAVDLRSSTNGDDGGIGDQWSSLADDVLRRGRSFVEAVFDG